MQSRQGCKKVFQNEDSYRKAGARMVTQSKLHTEDPKTLFAIVQNLVDRDLDIPSFRVNSNDIMFTPSFVTDCKTLDSRRGDVHRAL